ncbi:MAG TPA: YggS family pyridoxal phosphate-dependent enzyme [Bacteroidales bacterium]|nr:YggS family pyridoxal phosphate-dependent enzyme [Bacteroidales bacterium]HRZ76802.1 YggS family pyridoxal phosphate-dependent enzyme [Bacteroidales bacterium]
MSIASRLDSIRRQLPEGVRLVAVSKNQSIQAIQEAYEAGQRIFGENKAQELLSKAPLLPADIEWHFIGHLQRNKVRSIIPWVSLIHSIDSLRLLQEVDDEAHKAGRIIPCLLQFHIAEEETKFGLDLGEAEGLIDSGAFRMMNNIRVHGVMGMATFTDDIQQLRREFGMLRTSFNGLRNKYFISFPEFRELSMGMSDDMLVAIEEGSTLVRIGTAIFGARNGTT